MIDARDAHSMHKAVLQHINDQDIFISVAAVSDYTPKEIFNGKLKKNNLPSKICLTCKRPFTWRKKWKLNWDKVKYCSKKCSK